MKLSEHPFPDWLHVTGDGSELLLDVSLTSAGSRTRIMGANEKRLRIQLELAHDGAESNQALVRFLAQALSVDTVQVSIVGGASNRQKTVRLQQVSAQKALWSLRA